MEEFQTDMRSFEILSMFQDIVYFRHFLISLN